MSPEEMPESSPEERLPSISREEMGIFRDYGEQIRLLITSSTDEDFNALIETIRESGEKGKETADLWTRLRKFYYKARERVIEREKERLKKETEASVDDKPVENKTTATEQDWEKIEGRNISYLILRGGMYSYDSGLRVARNMLGRYPNESEAEILLRELKEKHKINQPIACFISMGDGKNEKGACFYLSKTGQKQPPKEGRPPSDTILYVIVVKKN